MKSYKLWPEMNNTKVQTQSYYQKFQHLASSARSFNIILSEIKSFQKQYDKKHSTIGCSEKATALLSEDVSVSDVIWLTEEYFVVPNRQPARN
jgi:hypothetical protein